MRKILKISALLMVFISAFIALFVNSDTGRKYYNKLFDRHLNKAINLLFVTPNKYLDIARKNRQIKGKIISYNFVEKEDGILFEAMENFIMQQYQGSKKIDYDIKAIATYRQAHYGTDSSNPDFYFAPVYFIKQVPDNKSFHELSGDELDKVVAGGETVTHQNALTYNLDADIGRVLLLISSGFIFASCILSIGLEIYEKR